KPQPFNISNQGKMAGASWRSRYLAPSTPDCFLFEEYMTFYLFCIIFLRHMIHYLSHNMLQGVRPTENILKGLSMKEMSVQRDTQEVEEEHLKQQRQETRVGTSDEERGGRSPELRRRRARQDPESAWPEWMKYPDDFIPAD
ncbi:hypothetical protein AVEN_143692-2-1, partial [Araneus ventricosus]